MAIRFTDQQVEEMLTRMSAGEALSSIARDPKMPSLDSMMDWEAKGDDLSSRITQARARGWEVRGEQAVEDAKKAEDASLGRLAFDAERWYLGKMMPKRFGDKIEVKAEHSFTEDMAQWLGNR